MPNVKMAEDHHTITPYMVIEGVEKQIEFLQKIMDVEVKEKIMRSEGVVMHAEVKIGDSYVMMADSTEQFRRENAMLYVYVEDTDIAYDKALKAGATTIMAPYDAEYGARMAGVRDPFGNSWWFATLK